MTKLVVLVLIATATTVSAGAYAGWFLSVSKKGKDGEWLYIRDTWNSDAEQRDGDLS